jgi:hypothetical protein
MLWVDDVFSLILNRQWAVTKWALWCLWHVTSTSLCWWLQNRGSCMVTTKARNWISRILPVAWPVIHSTSTYATAENSGWLYKPSYSYVEPGPLSWYSDMLWAGRGSILGTGKRPFSTPERSARLWKLPSSLSNGYRGLPLVSRSRMMELYSTLHYVFTAWWLIKHRNNFTFCPTGTLFSRYFRCIR